MNLPSQRDCRQILPLPFGRGEGSVFSVAFGLSPLCRAVAGEQISAFGSATPARSLSFASSRIGYWLSPIGYIHGTSIFSVSVWPLLCCSISQRFSLSHVLIRHFP